MTLALFAAAGRGARLVGRPRSRVAHLYVGPLTPSGRTRQWHRTVCGAHMLPPAVLAYPQVLTGRAARRVCQRCHDSLVGAGLPDRRGAVPHRRPRPGPRTRDEHLATYGHLTPTQLAVHATTATTRAEADLVAYLELLLFTVAEARKPLRPGGPSLHDHIAAARRAVRDATPTDRELARVQADREQGEADLAALRNRKRQAWADREAAYQAARPVHPREREEARKAG